MSPSAPNVIHHSIQKPLASFRARLRQFDHWNALLCVFPLLSFGWAMLAAATRGPYYLSHVMDPEYMYLLNSLNLATLHSPGHIDHPGTTMQLLGALVIYIHWVVSNIGDSWTPLRASVLLHHDAYLRSINLVTNALIAISMLVSARSIYRTSKLIAPALLLQAFPFVYFTVSEIQTRVEPDALLIAIVMLLVIPFTKLFWSDLNASGEAHVRAVVSFGVILGVGLATKVTVLPLLGYIFLLRRPKDMLRCAICCGMTAVVLVLPAVAEWPRMLGWFARLIMHSGLYGQGPVGVPGGGVFLKNLADLYSLEPAIFIMVGFYTALLILFGVLRNSSDTDWACQAGRILFVGILSILVQIVLAAKHHFPGETRYLVPSLIASSVLNAGIALALTRLRGQHSGALRMVVLVGCGVLLWSAYHQYGRITGWLEGTRAYRASGERIAAAAKKQGDCIRIGYGWSTVPTYGLFLGNDYSHGVHSRTLQELYPAGYLYGGTFRTFGADLSLRTVEQMVAEHSCVLLQGTPLAGGPPEYRNGLAGFVVTPILELPLEGLYRLSK